MRNPRNTSVALPSSELHTGVTPASESDSINHNQQTSATTTALPQHTSEDHLTIVIKLGSSSIVNEDDFQPQLALLSSIVETVCNLRRKGHRVVLVSSGAIAMGLKRMEMRNKPKILAEKQVSPSFSRYILTSSLNSLACIQALAAIGQGRLIALWDNLFAMLGQPIAQVLLTRSDISDVGALSLVLLSSYP